MKYPEEFSCPIPINLVAEVTLDLTAEKSGQGDFQLELPVFR